MTFDTLTWVSLVIFIGVLIGFVYACLMRSCIDSFEKNNRLSDANRRDKS
jgi:uncharacterized membrane protein